MNNTIFINLTNHPSDSWCREQIEAAHEYGTIVDIPFPNVPAEVTSEDVSRLCDDIIDKVMSYRPVMVLCQGEFTLAFRIINRLLDKDIPVVAACSERIAVMNGNKKESYFNFKQFRKYDR